MTSDYSTAALTFFTDPPRDGPANMAIDGALLEAAGGQGVLRLYRWSPATLSLGYFQKYDDPQRLCDPQLSRLPVVRRCTGGGAIVHADELTYSLVLPLDHPLAGSRPADLYHWMHARIAEAIASLGAADVRARGPGGATARGGEFLCFAAHASFDLMAGQDKLAGSAQRRTRSGLLQHGSVVLARAYPIQPSAAVGDLLSRPVGFEEMAAALVAAIRAAGTELLEAGQTLTSGAAFAQQLQRHSAADWIRRL
jgi:lipoate-protein ligase A